MPTYPIRPAGVADLPRLQAIERAAGLLFAEVGMARVAADEPLPLAELGRYQAAGRAWVAVDTGTADTATANDSDEAVVAYLIADVVDGGIHIEQVSVDPRCAHHGIGRALIDHVAAWSLQRGYSRLTLTTFVAVPWNGPYYRRCGFRPVPEAEITSGLREIRRHEAEHGLDQWPRCVMRRELG